MEKEKKSKKGLIGFAGVIVVLAILVATTFNLIKTHLNLGLDLQGGFEILYEVEPLSEGGTMDMAAVTNAISKRVDTLGVSEPEITVEGDDRVRVQLAGVSDQEAAREMLGTTANLTFRDIDDNELADASILSEGGASLGYEDGAPVVSLKIADTAKFAEITSEIAAKSTGENLLIIWLDWEEGDTYAQEALSSDPKYISAASVNSEISGDCIISGNFTESEARTLANLINSGSLPVKMTEISSNVVSAEYGADALQKTALAGAVGIAVIMLFMIVMFRMPGIISAIMLVFYLWAVFGLYALMGAVFTLSGIGALVLGVGMTVDANIINYERIKQELYKGHAVPLAVSQGQKQSLSAVFDAQFTTLLAGLIMYIWGNGAVRGFATMLIVTVVMTLILNVAFSRWLLGMVVSSGIADNKPEWFGVKKSQIPDIEKGEKQFYTGTHQFKYTSKAKYFIGFGSAVIALALIMCVANLAMGNGFLNLGIDFSSGTKITVTAEETITVSEIEGDFYELGYTSFSYQAAGENTVYATTKDSLSTDELAEIKDYFYSLYGIEPGDNVVTPVVGRELVRNAVILTLVAWIAMMAYVTFRYEWDYAAGCLTALIHDVAIVMAVFGILRMEVNTEVISVLLTIIGYSINNSIVVFDRVRENMAVRTGALSGEGYTDIVNLSLDETIRMSLNSAFTTIIPVVFLLLLGSNAIFTFIFAMFIGLIAGTFSSIFIAPTVWRYLRCHKKPQKPGQKKAGRQKKREQLDEYTIKGINA